MRQRRVFGTRRLYPPSSPEDRLASNPRLALPTFIILGRRRKNGPVPRYTPAEMTPAQRRVHDLIVSGRRGRFGGPFQLLIRAPEICEHAAKLGEHLRWGTSLRTDFLSLRLSPPPSSGARNTSGMRTLLSPRRPVSLLRQSKPSAVARRRALNRLTKRSFIASSPSCFRPVASRTRRSTR